MNTRNLILEGLNTNRIDEAAIKPEIKELMNKASLIGHEWWRYLDSKYFGVVSNYASRVGYKTTGSDPERMCGRYVCMAGFNSSEYSSLAGFIAGFNISKIDPSEMEVKIYHYEQDLKVFDRGGAAAVLNKSGIKDTGREIKFPMTEIESQHVRFAKVLADMVNDLAKKEPKSGK